MLLPNRIVSLLGQQMVTYDLKFFCRKTATINAITLLVTIFTSKRIISRFYCDFLVTFVKNWNAIGEKCRSEYANLITNIKNLFFSAFLITENLKNSRFMKLQTFMIIL